VNNRVSFYLSENTFQGFLIQNVYFIQVEAALLPKITYVLAFYCGIIKVIEVVYNCDTGTLFEKLRREMVPYESCASRNENFHIERPFQNARLSWRGQGKSAYYARQ
jgi:hypothetical protein